MLFEIWSSACGPPLMVTASIHTSCTETSNLASLDPTLQHGRVRPGRAAAQPSVLPQRGAKVRHAHLKTSAFKVFFFGLSDKMCFVRCSGLRPDGKKQ